MSQRDWQGAVQDCTKDLEIEPQSAESYNMRGRVREELGDRKGAIEDWTKAIEKDPKFAPALRNRGHARIQRGDFQAAIGDLERALAGFPERSPERQSMEATLAALIAPPRAHLVHYSGILAPQSAAKPSVPRAARCGTPVQAGRA